MPSHLADFITVDNFGRRLKTLKGRSPYEYICGTWMVEPDRFAVDPNHQMPGTEHLGMPPGASIFQSATWAPPQRERALRVLVFFPRDR
jgi:hypothetical protein